jgi:drug/metabolite transporter (DMT)-like permease
MNTETIAVLLSEATLSLYPILIKNVNTDLATQLFFRLGTYSSLTGVLAEKRDISATWGSLTAAGSSLAYGLMNLVHIGSSYVGFANLPAGTAMALFYTYPLLNILAGVLFLGDSFDFVLLPFFAMAIIGVYLLSQKDEGESSNQTDKKKTSWALGLTAIAIAAITETMIFIVAKIAPGTSNAFYPMLQLYVGAFFLLCGGLIGMKKMPDWSAGVPLIFFNVFIGFVGYLMRFYAIPLLPTSIFSLLSFIGVVTAYGWGKLFAYETPTLQGILGAALVTASIGGIRFINR